MDMEGLSLICAGLDMVEEDERGNQIGYYKDAYCLGFAGFLKRDNPQTREVFKQVCKWNIVSKYLIPIIDHCEDDRNLVLNAVKICVLTSSPPPRSCRSAAAVIWWVFDVLSRFRSGETFTEDDWKLVQLALTLFHNVLAVQDIPLQQKAGCSASQFITLSDGFLELLFNENVMDISLMITPHIGEDTKDALDRLKSLVAEEEEKRRLSRLHQKMVRHSQFSGKFTRLAMV
ncbi:hypothetical protein Pint_17598 [Pistacia integerrima]|uniref:Uncharacterized protein n=1 Tax=Pistacia integerrima TaxID=434235 RepID=A0ACC0YUQ8_9ROSI|nr:hypothetical protein Pint_17598 [Pistacia integerrima]